MTAYELAKELELMLLQIGIQDNRIPKMLRQQEDKINELEEKLKSQTDCMQALESYLTFYEDKFTDFDAKKASDE